MVAILPIRYWNYGIGMWIQLFIPGFYVDMITVRRIYLILQLSHMQHRCVLYANEFMYMQLLTNVYPRSKWYIGYHLKAFITTNLPNFWCVNFLAKPNKARRLWTTTVYLKTTSRSAIFAALFSHVKFSSNVCMPIRMFGFLIKKNRHEIMIVIFGRCWKPYYIKIHKSMQNIGPWSWVSEMIRCNFGNLY